MYEYNGGDSRIAADITAYMNGYKNLVVKNIL